MTVALERRLRKLEAQALSPREETATMLFEPPEGAEPEVWATHRKALSDAEATYDRVIVITPLRSLREKRDSVVYVPNEGLGLIDVLAHKPSKTGSRTALDDVVKSLSGNVFRPNASAKAHLLLGEG